MTEDPCAPIRHRVKQIQEELQKRQGQGPGQSPQILTPDQVTTDLASKSDQQLQTELRAAQQQLAECEAAQAHS